MFHNKTKLPGDKQYYYEFNATGMDKKGVKIWIKQVSRVIFILKTHFHINLFNPGLGTQNPGNLGFILWIPGTYLLFILT
jgi:hypothetical protein